MLTLLQDTAGSERYEAMSRIYYRGAKAAVVCYGMCKRFKEQYLDGMFTTMPTITRGNQDKWELNLNHG